MVPNQSWECYRVPAGGIACYSSIDLKNWHFKGVVLKPTIGINNSSLDTSKVIERPRVIFNNETKKFVMWIHLDKNDYTEAEAGVAVSDTPDGLFHLVYHFKPNNEDSRDMTIFKDSNGKAYLYNSSENNNSIHVNELTEDYLQVKPHFETILKNQRREAPAVFKVGKDYYLVTSLCTGWAPNEALIAIAKNPMGPWEQMYNPCIGTNANITFGSQISHVTFDHMANQFIAISDVWDKTNLKNSNYILIPITFLKGRVRMVASNIY
jgi:beta-xylosidase